MYFFPPTSEYCLLYPSTVVYDLARNGRVLCAGAKLPGATSWTMRKFNRDTSWKELPRR
jgi:hypothetical protein